MSKLGFHCHALDHFDDAIISNELDRGEFYNFPQEDLPRLKRQIEHHNLAASVHAPLGKISWYPDPPTWSYLCDIEEEKRNLTLSMIQETMGPSKEIGAEYIVVHFPSPPSTNDSEIGYDKLREIAWGSALSLQELSSKYDLPIHIEGFGPSPFLSVDFLIEVITYFPGLFYCFDIGHMHIASHRDGFDFYQVAEQISPYIGSIHLWNNRGVEDYRSFRHIPVHPSQSPEDGWIDVARVLQLILQKNPSCSIVLESGLQYPEELGGHDLHEGVKWVKDIVTTLS